MADQNIVVEEPRPGFFSNIVAILGLIVLIAIVIWGLVHLASLSKNWFSSVFHWGTPSIQVTVPANVNSGTPFNVTWKYNTSDKGNYALLYQCRAGLELKANTTTIHCGAAYTIGATTSLSITPSLTGTSTVTLPLTVVFLPSATSSQQAQGSATVNIHAVAIPANSTPTKPTTSTEQTTATTPVNTSPADLSVNIIAIGVIDPISGMFVNRAPTSQNDIAAAQFDIANVGGSSSGTYYFNASLPITSGYAYTSPAQAPLSPGSHVVNTLRFSPVNPGGGTFSVTITTNDANGANNYAAQVVAAGYYPQY